MSVASFALSGAELELAEALLTDPSEAMPSSRRVAAAVSTGAAVAGCAAVAVLVAAQVPWVVVAGCAAAAVVASVFAVHGFRAPRRPSKRLEGAELAAAVRVARAVDPVRWRHVMFEVGVCDRTSASLPVLLTAGLPSPELAVLLALLALASSRPPTGRGSEGALEALGVVLEDEFSWAAFSVLWAESDRRRVSTSGVVGAASAAACAREAAERVVAPQRHGLAFPHQPSATALLCARATAEFVSAQRTALSAATVDVFVGMADDWDGSLAELTEAARLVACSR